MHPTLSHHYEEELAFLVLAGRAVLIRKFVFRFLRFERKQPCAGNPVNHFRITVRTF